MPASGDATWLNMPRDTPEFIDRQEILHELDAVLTPSGMDELPSIIIEGMPGVGKTAAAVHWATEVANRFPDGAIFIDLRGHSIDMALTQHEALRQLLILMRVPDQQIPEHARDRAAMYQERLAG